MVYFHMCVSLKPTGAQCYTLSTIYIPAKVNVSTSRQNHRYGRCGLFRIHVSLTKKNANQMNKST